ncbi:protein of unknown function [endosymbiont DhMRE of Dentiscutata heterogama]|nr:protein of unknown function [endosymbiont DhMRE of Dentiscutata heterogama]
MGLINDWGEIWKKDGGVTQNNFQEVINRARRVLTYLKKLEPLCNPPVDELDVKLLNWVREKKVQYETLAFDIETHRKKLSRLNDELLMVRIDNERTKGCLFIIFEGAGSKEVAREQFDLFYEAHQKIILYTNEKGYCDAFSLLSYLEEVKTRFPYPFTYAFIPEGDKEIAEELLRDTLGRELNSKKLKEAYFSKEIKKPDSFPVFRVKVGEKRPNEEIVERGYFYADPRYHSDLKEKEISYAK